MAEQLKELLSFMQDKGFVWGPSPEIYGGMSGFYTYGPLGKRLKHNVEEAIRKVFNRHEFYEIECPTVLPRKVWEASGHLSGFTDPLINCSKCASTFRADSLIEEFFPDHNTSGMKEKDLLDFIKEKKMRCPSCKGQFEEKIVQHTLMMRTTIGVDTEAYNRPETATATYLPFLRNLKFFRDKLPFGVFQIGKAYRNEISPRQHLLRCREFTQAEGQMFIFEKQKESFERFERVKDSVLPLWDFNIQNAKKPPVDMSAGEAVKKGLLQSKAYAWTLVLAYELFVEMGIPKDRIRFRQHHPHEKAFYAADAWDIEIKLNSFGWTECCGVHDRTSYDLTQHAKFSGEELVARDENNEKQVPHVLEIAFGTDRPTFSLLDIFYEKKEKEEGKTKLMLPYKLAPVQVAIFPLVNKPELLDMSRDIFEDLSREFMCQFDKSGAIGAGVIYTVADKVT